MFEAKTTGPSCCLRLNNNSSHSCVEFLLRNIHIYVGKKVVGKKAGF